MTYLFAFLLLTALTVKTVDFGLSILQHNWRAVSSQYITWVLGVAVVGLFAHTHWGDQMHIGSSVVSSLSISALVMLGCAVASAASVIEDLVSRLITDQYTKVIPKSEPLKQTATLDWRDKFIHPDDKAWLMTVEDRLRLDGWQPTPATLAVASQKRRLRLPKISLSKLSSPEVANARR